MGIVALGRVFLIILGIYFGYQLIIKPFLRIFIGSLIRDFVKNEFEEAGRQQHSAGRKEGSIHVDHVPEKKSKQPSTKNVKGEYVDFEELK